MTLPVELQTLTDPAAYPHPCDAVEVVETHISWVLLTGEFAYKLKKPVRFSFLDFSTLAQREHFCREELRCNRRFAPSLYLDVVKVVRGPDGALRMDGPGDAIEWAVKMFRFDPDAQLDRLLAHEGLEPPMLERFGTRLAHQHEGLPSRRFPASDLSPRVLQPAADNFDDISGLESAAGYGELLSTTRRASDAQVQRHRDLMLARLAAGRVRECHGDLHLSNLVLLDDDVVAFDCLEFNEDLRWIDPQSDTAFLLMDCLVHGRPDLGYAFVDGYLDESGDYEGATLLPFYAAYRSMVRAKVAAMRHDQASPAHAATHAERMAEHLRWAADWLTRPPGRL
jgi:aminoglycoside phosphotransferase family enzyme